MIEPSDPILRFTRAFEEAKKKEPSDPSAFVLATAGPDGKPAARVVLLKHFDNRGFVFYTNLKSRKARELHAVRYAALCFYWPTVEQQVRIEGRIEQVPDEEADSYFATRPRGAQVGAWASNQSAPLSSRAELEKRFKEVEQKFAGRDVQRPPFWSGFRLIPEQMEFWRFWENRLHDRTLYSRAGEEWKIQKLYP